jgi:hypothetical protein
MKPIVILRYHDHFPVVAQRVEWLRQLNHGITIHGMFGGKGSADEIVPLLDSNYKLTLDPFISWLNLDLAVLEWYRAFGRQLDYTHAYIVEWDLVYLRPLNEVLPVPEDGQSLLTGYTDMSEIEDRWVWTAGDTHIGTAERYWRVLRSFVTKHYAHHPGFYHACLGPGTVLSRRFFDEYDRLRLPSWCHDEIRMPLIHQLAGLPVADNGLYPAHWYEPATVEWATRFNTERVEVTPEKVYESYQQGYYAFHPVYQILDEAACGLGVTALPGHSGRAGSAGPEGR